MSDPIQPESPAPLTGEPSPEELEAAAAASEDALSQTLAELATLKAKSAELADQYLRAQADVQNARRRAEDEIAKARKFALESFAESLLPVLDSLEAGLAIQSATPEQIREGAEATLRQLRSALERNKVLEINPPQARSSIRTTTRPSAWCRPTRKPTPWSPCCRRATASPSACCAQRWSPWRRRNKNDLKPLKLSTRY
jgi:molecular chaperone GrpE